MVHQAEEYAEQDKQKKEEVELRNEADSMIYTSERTAKDLSDKMSQADKDRLNAAVQELRTAIAGKDVAELRVKYEAVKKILQEVGTAVYQQVAQQQAQAQGQAQPQEQAQAEPQGGGPNGNVTDAEYKVVDEGKK